MSVIEFAEKRLNEENNQANLGDCRYWAAYLDGARAQAKEDEKRLKELGIIVELGSVVRSATL